MSETCETCRSGSYARRWTEGNGIASYTEYDPANGWLYKRQAGVGGGTGRIDAQVTWDRNGNFTTRQDLKQSVTETFVYDPLNRLDYSQRNGVTNLDVTLDAIGNVTWKSDVGNFTYHATKRRAVVTAGANSYGYDANGNMTTRNGSTINYASYNLPISIASGSNSSTLAYGAWRNTVKQVAVNSGTTETTVYVAGLLEKVTKGTTTEYRHRIEATPGTVAIYVRKSSGSNATYYLHRDHLGSPEMITNASGNSVVKLSFSAYGERRDVDWDGPITSSHLTSATNVTRHGYTDHLHLDSVKLVHMGGRVYDPVIGRFLSRDPYIDGVDSSQGANGYAYVWNNPLSRWDPTGFNSTIPGRGYRSWANHGQWECQPGPDQVCVTAQRPPDPDPTPDPAPNPDPFASLDPHWLKGLPNDSTEQLLYGYDIAWGAAGAAIAAAPSPEGLTSAASALSTSKSLDPVTTGRLLPLSSIADRLDASKLIKSAGALGAVASVGYGLSQGPESARYAVIDVGAGALAVIIFGPVVGGSAAVVYAVFGGSESIIGLFD